PWPDLPERFGKWDTAYQRFNRWAQKGVWQRLLRELQDPDLEWLILDSTVIRAHQHAAGNKGGTRRSRWAAPAAASAPRCASPWVGWATRSRPCWAPGRAPTSATPRHGWPTTSRPR